MDWILGGLMAYGLYQQDQAAKAARDAQNEANRLALQNAQEQKQLNIESINSANQKKPNTATFAARQAMAAQAGFSSTMFTGPGGIDPSSLLLGKNTLLGS